MSQNRQWLFLTTSCRRSCLTSTSTSADSSAFMTRRHTSPTSTRPKTCVTCEEEASSGNYFSVVAAAEADQDKGIHRKHQHIYNLSVLSLTYTYLNILHNTLYDDNDNDHRKGSGSERVGEPDDSVRTIYTLEKSDMLKLLALKTDLSLSKVTKSQTIDQCLTFLYTSRDSVFSRPVQSCRILFLSTFLLGFISTALHGSRETCTDLSLALNDHYCRITSTLIEGWLAGL